ncbi:MAG: YdeI/OmpD-associated family protein [Pseudomonadota bacterium]
MQADRFERVEVHSQQELWAWLEAHHQQAESVWLVTWKAAHPKYYVSREQVLDALIAFGWIDGRRMKLDAHKTMQLISPRKQQAWAKSYKERASRLEKQGLMKPSGEATVLNAKASGSWEKMTEVDELVVPDDLGKALRQNKATKWWTTAAPSYRRNVLRWIASAKKAETRSNRVQEVAQLAAVGEKVPHY